MKKNKSLKLLIVIYICLIFLIFSGCKKGPRAEDLLVCNHEVNTSEDLVYPYLFIKCEKTDDNNYTYSLTYYSSFTKKYLKNRYMDYYQVDYIVSDTEFDYYHHIFDYIDGVLGTYNQNFCPMFKTTKEIKTLQCLLEYSYDEMIENDNYTKVEKRILFKEDIIAFKDDIINESGYNIKITKQSKADEDYNRYKMNIILDESLKEGHFDIQTYIKVDDQVIPFVGYYHYYAQLGNINSVSDIKISKDYNFDDIYCFIKYYDINNNCTDYNIKGIVENG